MCDGDDIVSIVRDRQLAIRRELDRRGISLKALSFDAKIPYQTIISYFPGERDRQPAVVPASALFKLVRVLPLDLISLLLPQGYAVIEVPEGLDHDEIAARASDYLSAYAQARHPQSEAGIEIGPREACNLTTKAAPLSVVAERSAS